MADKEEKKSDFLDEVKELERRVRARTLAKMLSTLKDKAREVLTLKEETDAIIEQLGVSTTDAKRLIDWINSLEQVKLSESDVKRIKERSRDSVVEERKESERKITEKPQEWSNFVPVYAGTASLTATTGNNITNATYTSTSNLMRLSNSGSSISLSL